VRRRLPDSQCDLPHSVRARLLQTCDSWLLQTGETIPAAAPSYSQIWSQTIRSQSGRIASDSGVAFGSPVVEIASGDWKVLLRVESITLAEGALLVYN
jgi:hypothetical protein